jgi:hypothetical protein
MTREHELEARLLSVIRSSDDYKQSAEKRLRGQKVAITKLRKQLESAHCTVRATKKLEQNYNELRAELRSYKEALTACTAA